MEFGAAELSRVKQQIQNLGRRDWLWVSIGLLSLLLLVGAAVGVFVLFPAMAAGALSTGWTALLVFLYVAAVVVVAFNVHALLKSKEAERVNVELLLESLENEVGRLHGMIDPITRAYNRTFLEEMLQREIVRAERTARVFTLVVVDLDKFKEINDTFGHLMGDYVLAEVGQILRSAVRGSDVVIRYGGDEFVLVLFETEMVGAEVVVGRIHKKVADWNRNNKVARFELMISTGISMFAEGKKVADMIAEADEKMYAMKATHHSAARITTAAQ
jgi:diguanylate cyclase (GGDEF)-like protein